MIEGHSVGIDLGATGCCVAIWEHDAVHIMKNSQSCSITASVVGFGSHETLLGLPAKFQAPMYPENTVFGSLRLLGRKFADVPHCTLQQKKVIELSEKNRLLVSV